MSPELRPVRKNSRYDFATDGEGEAAPPEGYPELLAYASPTEPVAPVPLSTSYVEQFEQLVAHDSPDKWLLDVVDARGRSASGTYSRVGGRVLFPEPVPEDNEIILVRSRSSMDPQL